MSKELQALFIADSDADTEQVIQELVRGGYLLSSRRVNTLPALAEALTGNRWDIIISACPMERFPAAAGLQMVKDRQLDVPFIIVLERLDEGLAVDAMMRGARDFLLRGDLSRLVPAIERGLKETAERKDRRKLQTAIRRGKMEWEAAFDAGSDLIILTDLSGRIIRCNRRMLTYFSCTYQEVLGKGVRELFYGAEPGDSRLFATVSGLGEELNEEDVRFPRLPGWFNVTSYPMQFEGKPYGMVHIVKDITKRRQAEEEKKLSERELLTLYAIAFRLNSPLGFGKVMKDLLTQLHTMLAIDFSAIHLLEKGKLRLETSRGLSRSFAAAIKAMPGDIPWVRQVLAGNTHQARVPAEDLPPEMAAAARAMGMQAWCALPLRSGEEIIGLILVAHRSAERYTDREIFLLQSIASQLAVLIENHTLYDKMKEQTRELQKSRAELQENLKEVRRANLELGRLNATKNRFIGMASHELKTPITSILGGVDFLFNYCDLPLTEEQRGIFTSVHEGVLQLKQLVDDLLSFSRVEASGALHKHPVDLMALAREVRENFSLPLSVRNLAVSIPDGGPPVPGDEGFCRLVIRNLLENAIKFTPDNGMITVTGREVERGEVLTWESVVAPFYPDFSGQLADSASFYRLDITDTGVGIPAMERRRVFDKFYGIGDLAYHSSGKTEFMAKGTGLGLAIVKSIMDNHQGLVWNGPNPDGTGTVFTLLFPME